MFVIEYELNGKLVNNETSLNLQGQVNAILIFTTIEFVPSNFRYLPSFIFVVEYELNGYKEEDWIWFVYTPKERIDRRRADRPLCASPSRIYLRGAPADVQVATTDATLTCS
jgi:hypothetical protein